MTSRHGRRSRNSSECTLDVHSVSDLFCLYPVNSALGRPIANVGSRRVIALIPAQLNLDNMQRDDGELPRGSVTGIAE
jgi:hypothetical protein